MYTQIKHKQPYLSITQRALLLVALAVMLWIVLPPVGAAAQEPDWKNHYPITNTITASLMTTVTITYDQPMSATTVTSRTFAVHGMQSGLVTETHGLIDGNRLIITPANGFHQGELVYAIATTRTTNVTGTSPLSATQWQFNAGVVSNRCVAGFNEDTAASANLTGVARGSVAWGDYDNDGDLDILLTGYDGGGYNALVYEN
ncbi:MAG: VCBS repeat-containing protein, partial [Chloroflexi bacterium]|nr:VCBS repeat-containing protein [Chloroflexota bacterium]